MSKYCLKECKERHLTQRWVFRTLCQGDAFLLEGNPPPTPGLNIGVRSTAWQRGGRLTMRGGPSPATVGRGSGMKPPRGAGQPAGPRGACGACGATARLEGLRPAGWGVHSEGFAGFWRGPRSPLPPPLPPAGTQPPPPPSQPSTSERNWREAGQQRGGGGGRRDGRRQGAGEALGGGKAPRGGLVAPGTQWPFADKSWKRKFILDGL